MVSLNDLTNTAPRPPAMARDGVTSFVAVVDGENAETLLLKNADVQRKKDEKNVDIFVKAQKSGMFFSGSALRFVWDGRDYCLVDGQHRLEAVVKSGIPASFTFVVTCGDPRVEYGKQDTAGKKRSMSDSMRAFRPGDTDAMTSTNLQAYVAALRIIAGDFSDKLDQTIADGNFQNLFDEYLDAYRVIASAPKLSKSNSTRGIQKSAVYAVALATARYAEQRTVQDFWGQVVDDNGLLQNDPRKKLHKFVNDPLLMGGVTGRMMCRVAATKCWNAFVNGKEIKQLKFTGKRIKIALTPFPSDGEEDTLE